MYYHTSPEQEPEPRHHSAARCKIPLNCDHQHQPSGQILILFALASFVLVGFMALAIDVGYLSTERREAQNAADAAALAGGIDLLRGEPQAAVIGTARGYGEMNRVTNGTNGTNVNVQVSGDHHDGEVVVEINNPVQRFLLSPLYSGPWEVGARAVTQINSNRDGKYTLVALKPLGIYVNGNMTIDVIRGSTISNGDVDRNGTGIEWRLVRQPTTSTPRCSMHLAGFVLDCCSQKDAI